ncbi:hypothetical protein BDW02DRAFT_569635 [Decorospora gaudefroyi]|uniref:Uncharacterized protein n=1 Tax=Decorospora gaudefroyi TaxID=184978 RepID=A0A6A5K7U2_9PLEO|nr:hypothetical protein BDW02DRAFT_569635 [Decorospora gaudefroyi]
MVTPSPQTWTLRLKSHKTTVLLHVDPLNTFDTIKSMLYDALQETELRHPETGKSIPLPSSPSELQLGRPFNVNEASDGFYLGEWEYAIEEEVEGKGKGKAKAESGRHCPKGAGLKDGTVLAFRWAGDGHWDGEDEFDIGKGRVPKEGETWGVKLATFEDAYGVENSMDLGGRDEFDG